MTGRVDGPLAVIRCCSSLTPPERGREAEREHDSLDDVWTAVESPVADRSRQARGHFAGAEALHGARGDDRVTYGAGRENRDGDVDCPGEAGVARESLALVAASDVGDVAERGEPDVSVGADGVRLTRGRDE